MDPRGKTSVPQKRSSKSSVPLGERFSTSQTSRDMFAKGSLPKLPGGTHCRDNVELQEIANLWLSRVLEEVQELPIGVAHSLGVQDLVTAANFQDRLEEGFPTKDSDPQRQGFKR